MESVLSAGDINSNPGRTVFACKSLSLSLLLSLLLAHLDIPTQLVNLCNLTCSGQSHRSNIKKRSLAIWKRSVSSLLGLRLQLSKMQQWASSAIIEGRVYQLKIAPGSLHISSWEKGNLFISVGLTANQWSLQMSTERKSMRHLAKALTKNSSCFVVSLQKRALNLLSNQLFLTPAVPFATHHSPCERLRVDDSDHRAPRQHIQTFSASLRLRSYWISQLRIASLNKSFSISATRAENASDSSHEVFSRKA